MLRHRGTRFDEARPSTILCSFAIITAVVFRCDRLNRIECGKTDEPGQETADMRLPRDRLLHTRHADRGGAEQEVNTEPYQQERKHAGIPERRDKRGRRRVSSPLAIMPQAERAPAREGK